MRRLQSLGLVIGSLVIGCLMTEVTYRAYLWYALDKRNRARIYDPKANFYAYYRPRVNFDAETGFKYVARPTWYARVIEGAFLNCSEPKVWGNEEGNVGMIFGARDAAEVQILVVGDSFTVQLYDGYTWVNLAQSKLQKRLGRTVNIRNFGRDGLGVLQMVDIAASKAQVLKPHYVVIAYITADLIRPRIWLLRDFDGKYTRSILKLTPDREVDPYKSYYSDSRLTNEGVTREWCDKIIR